jgi:hypothetical protein
VAELVFSHRMRLDTNTFHTCSLSVHRCPRVSAVVR